jgi:DNA-binding MarR family transcriptional regulator
MKIFEHLAKIRKFEKTHLPFLVTLEDFDIVRVIGLHQERNELLLLKQLYFEGIGSYATVTRRVGKLRAGGYVLATASATDGRAVALSLSPGVQKIYHRYDSMLKGLTE